MVDEKKRAELAEKRAHTRPGKEARKLNKEAVKNGFAPLPLSFRYPALFKIWIPLIVSIITMTIITLIFDLLPLI